MREPCLSDFSLDRHLLGELSVKEKQAVSDHLSSCRSCRSRYEALASFSNEMEGRLPPFQEASSARHPPRDQTARNVTVMGLGLAMAAGFSMFLAPQLMERVKPGASEMEAGPQMSGEAEPEEVAVKGSIRLSYHVKRGEEVRLAGPNELLAPNDQIQFSFDSEETGYLAILNVDGALATNVYFPTEGAAAFWDPAKSEMPHSIILDDVLGRDVFLAVFCENNFSTEAARQELAKNASDPTKFDFAGCRKDVLFATKVDGGRLGPEVLIEGKP